MTPKCLETKKHKEEYWPYVVSDFDKEPTSFCYAFAQNYQAIRYFRLDPPRTSKNTLLGRIKILDKKVNGPRHIQAWLSRHDLSEEI